MSADENKMLELQLYVYVLLENRKLRVQNEKSLREQVELQASHNKQLHKMLEQYKALFEAFSEVEPAKAKTIVKKANRFIRSIPSK